MQSPVDSLSLLAGIIGVDVKGIINSAGDFNQLTTEQKSNLVFAFNEFKSSIPSSTDGFINDLISANDSAFSSNKIISQINAAIDALKNNAPLEFDTLKEIATWIATDQTLTTNILNQINKRLRYDQSVVLTQPQLETVHANINLGNFIDDYGFLYELAVDRASNLIPEKDVLWDYVVASLSAKNGTISDAKGNSILLNSNVSASSEHVLNGPQSLKFPVGTLNYLITNGNSYLPGDFTIEGYFYMTDPAMNRDQSMVCSNWVGGWNPTSFWCGRGGYLPVSMGKVIGAFYGIDKVLVDPNPPILNAFVHYRWERVGTVITMYRMGKPVDQANCSLPQGAPNIKLRFGNNPDNVSVNGSFVGYMEGVRVTNYARDGKEFNPPTYILPNK